jgi:hypothetical protein
MGVDAHIWFSEKISAMCSLSQSISLRAAKENSSISDSAISIAALRSSVIQAADPTATGGPRRIAILGLFWFDVMEGEKRREVNRVANWGRGVETQVYSGIGGVGCRAIVAVAGVSSLESGAGGR